MNLTSINRCLKPPRMNQCTRQIQQKSLVTFSERSGKTMAHEFYCVI